MQRPKTMRKLFANRFALALSIATMLVPTSGRAQTSPVDIYDSGGVITPEQAAFDVTFYDITLNVDPDERAIDGSVLTAARIVSPTSRLVLNLDTLLTVSDIVEVRGNREIPTQWSRDGGRIWIDLGRQLGSGEDVAVRVAYSGHPRVAPQAPWDGGFVWARTESGRPWIATAVQGEGPDVWWPAKDHVSDKPDSVGLHITVPEGLIVATNGRPTFREENADGTTTFHNHVSTPISAYNVALNIAPYELHERQIQSVAGTPLDVTFYALPEDHAEAVDFMDEIIEHLRFFERRIGPYPFRIDGYKVAQTPHLGMEHQSVIAYGADYDNGAMTGGRDWGFDALHHHELSHEWWGNLVTNADWKDMWLHEGFGTYMQVLYAEELGGEDLMLEYLLNEWRNIANRTPVAPLESRTSGEIYFDAGGDIYSKGAWVLHMLRGVMGDEAFFSALRRMAYPTEAAAAATNGSQVRSADTDDFLAIAEAESGQELDWFFDVYLHQPALPRLAARRTAGMVEFQWVVPGGAPFPMPLEVEVEGDVTRLDMSDGSGILRVDDNREVLVDPHFRVLRENQLARRIAPL